MSIGLCLVYTVEEVKYLLFLQEIQDPMKIQHHFSIIIRLISQAIHGRITSFHFELTTNLKYLLKYFHLLCLLNTSLGVLYFKLS